MNYLRISVAAVWLFAGGAADSYAQSTTGQCGVGDSACYIRQYENACTVSGTTVQSCEALVRAIESRAKQDDRAARHAVAVAYSAIATHLSKDGSEKSRARVAGLAIYRELALSDPSDSEALLGISGLTDNPKERLDLLRRVVRLRPTPITAQLLATELKKTDRPDDLVETAEAYERLYESSNERVKWRVAVQVIGAYGLAGLQDRAAAFRQRVRRELGADALLNELSQVRLADPERTSTILERLCDPQVAQSAGAEFCLRGLDTVLPALPRAADRARAQRSAESAASLLANVAFEAENALIEADPGWRTRSAKWLDGLASQGFASGKIYAIRSSVELNPARKVQILEQALRVVPEDKTLLSALAHEYFQQRRLDEAIELLRKARDLPTTTSEERRMHDQNIQAFEKVRDAARASSQRR